MDAIYIHRRDSGTGGRDTPDLQKLTLGSLFDGYDFFSLKS